MIEAFTARSGHLSLRVNGIALHSPYDPVKEAERFAETSLPADVPSTIVILGEGLGYATDAFQRRFPGSRVISLHYCEEAFKHSIAKPSLSWHPDSGQELADFARGAIGELEVEGLRVVEWPPSARIFREKSREANRSVQQAVQEASGSFRTTVGCGRTWIRNALLNFLSFDSILTGAPCAPRSRILIAAPGPSLEGLLPMIAKKRASFDIWALPSSLLALADRGIRPDLVVLTDPGYWSAMHLHFSGIRCPIAMPFSAAPGAWRTASPMLPLFQPTFFERELFSRARISAPEAPPHGTVAATAIELALAFSREPVMVAGADMCVRDIISHVRPNAFDRLLWMGSGRFAPHYSTSFHRASSIPFDSRRDAGQIVRVPLQLKTYAGWLGSSRGGNVLRLRPSPVELPSMTRMSDEKLLALPDAPGGGESGTLLHEDPSYPARDARRSIVGALLDEWMESLEAGLSAVKLKGNARELARSQTLLSLAYYIEARLLAEARRKVRLGRLTEARGLAVELIEGSLLFLRALREKLGT
jgi:hypothetical protein